MPEFVIHEIPVLNGTLAISPIPGRTRHYATDRERLLAWHPNIVISMTTLPELARKGAASLPEDLVAEGIKWIHLPIEDFGTPDHETERKWPDASQRARACLSAKGKVLVHCFGGCGRSGMACLRLMIDAGEEATRALTRLRFIRPCAIETEAQMEWATRPA